MSSKKTLRKYLPAVRKIRALQLTERAAKKRQRAATGKKQARKLSAASNTARHADTQDWPAPLCIQHAPEPLIDTAIALRAELDRMLGLFDGAHQTDCNMFHALGRASSDLELSLHIERGGRSICSCGFYAIRQEVRARFGLPGDARQSTPPARKELLS